MHTQGTGCLFTYDPGIKEILQIHSRAFEVPNTYVRWEGRELFITRFVADRESADSYGSVMWGKFCDWFENTGYFQPTYHRAEWNKPSVISGPVPQPYQKQIDEAIKRERVTAANNSR